MNYFRQVSPNSLPRRDRDRSHRVSPRALGRPAPRQAPPEPKATEATENLKGNDVKHHIGGAEIAVGTHGGYLELVTLKRKKNHCVCGNSMNLYTCMYREKFWRSAMFIVHVDFREVQTRSKFSGDHWDVPNVFLDRLVQESLWIYLDIDGHVNMTARNKNAHPTGIRILYLHT